MRISSSLSAVVMTVLAGSLLSDRVDAQSPRSVSVQLPTFEQFGVSTTVVVPDRGSLYLGGVNRSGLGRSQFGPGVPGLGNRGIGRSSSAGGLSISATIIDHREIDRALLAEAARRRGDKFDIYGRPVESARVLSPAVTQNRTLVRARDGRNPLSPPRYRQSSRNTADAEARRATTYMQRARRAETKGELRQAMIFYRRVAKYGDAQLKKHAETRLAQLEQATSK